jgi:hypothetical protein
MFDGLILMNLARFFAAKLRAGLGYALWKRTGEVARLQQAVNAYDAALVAWRHVKEYGKAYRDDITVGGEPFLRGQWKDRIGAIEDDLRDMRAELANAIAAGRTVPDDLPPLDALEQAPPAVEYQHTPPASFERGQPVQIGLFAYTRAVPRLTLHLHYRRLNQAEAWQSVEMIEDEGRSVGTIPADVTDSPYPIQYYVELRDNPGRAWLYPGLDETLSNRPYFVVR